MEFTWLFVRTCKYHRVHHKIQVKRNPSSSFTSSSEIIRALLNHNGERLFSSSSEIVGDFFILNKLCTLFIFLLGLFACLFSHVFAWDMCLSMTVVHLFSRHFPIFWWWFSPLSLVSSLQWWSIWSSFGTHRNV